MASKYIAAVFTPLLWTLLSAAEETYYETPLPKTAAQTRALKRAMVELRRVGAL